MSRMTTFVIMMVGITLLFHFMGLIENTPNNTLLNLALDPEGVNNDPFFTKVLLAVEGIAIVGAIILGAIRNFELVTMGPFVVILINLLLDFISVFSVVYASIGVLAILIFSPLFIVYLLTAMDWWRGIS